MGRHRSPHRKEKSTSLPPGVEVKIQIRERKVRKNPLKTKIYRSLYRALNRALRKLKALDSQVKDLTGRRRRRSVSRKLRQRVWEYYHGSSHTGKCYCCLGVIRRGPGWHCSHVVARAHGGPDELSNLRTCCPSCNIKMGTTNMYEYIKRGKK